jgi:hypothetical protein
MIHAGEGVGKLRLDFVPASEIADRPAVLREQRAVVPLRRRRKFETDEFELLRGDEFLKMRNGGVAFLHMKQQIAALAEREEIVEAGNAATLRSGVAASSCRQRRISGGEAV